MTARSAFLTDLGAPVVGAVFLAFTIAPTDEIRFLAAKLDYRHELALIGLSLGVGYIVVVVSGYGKDRFEQPGPFQHLLPETVFSCIVSLSVALGSLHLFNRIEADDPIGLVVSMVLVLGLPATIGGAAGRLVV